MERSIIHLNIADFAAAVETTAAPALEGYPLVVAHTGTPRPRVYDMSNQAFQEGIRKGMPLARVRQIDKKIKIIPPRFHWYAKAMKALFKQAAAYTPVIESGPWDGHFFLDVTGTQRLFGPPQDLALRLNREMKKKFGLDPVWSVATNKLVAKVATRVVKPVGGHVVTPGEEQDFLTPLPIALVPGLSKKEILTLKSFNLIHIFQARSLTLEQLNVTFAQRAGQIHQLIRGIDETPVLQEAHDQLLATHEFREDTHEATQVRGVLFSLVETLCRSLRSQGKKTSHLVLTLSYSDGGLHKAAAKPFSPTANDMALFLHALSLLARAWKRRVRIRHLALACKNPVRVQIQPSLFPEVTRKDREEKLLGILDRIQTRFGKKGVQRALTLEIQLPEGSDGEAATPQRLAGWAP